MTHQRLHVHSELAISHQTQKHKLWADPSYIQSHIPPLIKGKWNFKGCHGHETGLKMGEQAQNHIIN